MRWSTAFIPTLRDDPAEVEADSHRLLLRAGFIRQLMSGHYALLPLAVRVRAKIIQIVREEMDAIGAQEFLMPTMHPAEIWKQSGRWDAIDDALFRLKDRKDQDLAMGMTHEEVFAFFFNEVQSYKDLPQSWYQFQTKLRDEARPKSGLLRVREFTMKDSYSFDLDEAGLDASFEAHKAAYVRIFKRLGIYALPVDASNGMMGGAGSTEFQAPAAIGEDIIVYCPEDGYAANIENANSTLPAVDDGVGPDAPERFDTPGVRTIVDLANFEGGAAADRQIKTLVFMIDGKIVLALLRGDHDLVEERLADATGGRDIRPAVPEEIKAALGANPGSLGAVGVSGFDIIADTALEGRTNMTTGANDDNVHFRGVDIARDITVTRWFPLRRVRAGEASPISGASLQEVNSIEVGHIFKLGYKYTEAFDVKVAGPNGEPVTPIMGSYGVGIDRSLAVIIETHNDDKGIVWPVAVAPFAVAVVAMTPNDEASMAAAEKLYADLGAAGLDVIIDDRDARAGVKLADVELIGIPLRVTVGKRSVANGTFEVTVRKTGETTEVPIDGAVQSIVSQYRTLLAEESGTN